MRTLAILTACFFGAAFAADEKDANKKDLEALNGEWQMVQGINNGQKLDEDRTKSARRITKDGETSIKIGDDVVMKAKFTLDAGKKPKQIDYKITEGPNEGQEMKGIYELDGDTLKFCFALPGTDRPTKFESKEDSNHVFSEWKKIKEEKKKDK